ncbi:PREDICTED: uncharacterized protein LOC108973628 [Bactrocera latifrons]|uniref:uncharacterized protein LOC108973628 n=1 Tax=Bactrocera latifrons TaxID=174628 RepID=UPI0008DD1903|nr:PREDICTED: uncharacterized protein LOC108973628 [Bactrocera latifrons]
MQEYCANHEDGDGKKKNVSLDVKNGAAQLDGLFDVMKSYRRNWLIAENEKRRGLLSRRITTPEPKTSKRWATSPVEPRETVRPRSEKDGEWQKVLSKKTRKIPATEGTENKNPKDGGQQRRNIASNQRAKSWPKRQSETVIIKPAEGNSYAEVLKCIRSKVNIREGEVKIKGIRKTRAGAALLELEKGQSIKASFCEALKTTLRESATVADLKPKATIEIRDLDSLSTKEEVAEAVKEVLQDSIEDLTISITYITLDEDKADILIRQARIKIDWVNCRLRLEETPKICFRCFGPGHLAWDCKGPDRRGQGACIKCGQPGHKMKECTKPPSCCLCVEAKHEKADHIPGSAKFIVYRKYQNK